jgi:hypothetical protein
MLTGIVLTLTVFPSLLNNTKDFYYKLHSVGGGGILFGWVSGVLIQIFLVAMLMVSATLRGLGWGSWSHFGRTFSVIRGV